MRFSSRIAIGCAALAAAGVLAACNAEPEVEPVETTALEDNTYVAVPVPVDMMNVTLSPEQQQRRSGLDQAGYYRDVRTLEDEYLATVEATPIPGGTGNMSGGSDMASTDSGGTMSGSAGSTSSDTTTMSDSTGSTMSGSAGSMASGGMDTGRMTFEELDRNDDGQLSVAEFAIYAVGLDPNAPKPNDETMPYARPEQLNRAADGFFYYDTNGDTYLQPDEFAAARQNMS
ncbi:hypothetical protein [Sphingosinithalassobacter sp. CS137]|uniref:hypothetical protein n=1 Tax=Sphingosinithalassobacter sp. CS137 TaxID=2762748 RepID=UPI00165E46D5|nr:hypothetical protein [Sphingosinithalassobacter sp. CS137]